MCWESLLPILLRLATRDHKDMCYKDEDCRESYDDEDAKRATGKARTKNTTKQRTERDPAEEPSQSRETVYMMFITI